MLLFVYLGAHFGWSTQNTCHTIKICMCYNLLVVKPSLSLLKFQAMSPKHACAVIKTEQEVFKKSQ